MKNYMRNIFRTLLLPGLVLTWSVGCEREVSDDVEFASFPQRAEIFIDGFSGGLEYRPFGGSKFDAFSVDTEVKYSGEASMRFDVPNFGDPSTTLGFAGAIFPDYGGRDLSGFDALTFWAKASRAETISTIGFGSDFGDSPYRDMADKFVVTKQNLRISTGWQKYIIPIPDPKKLINETGMFWYAEGPDANGDGYTFWIDELKFEKLGTIAQPRPAIFGGEDLVDNAFLDIQGKIPDAGLTQTFNLSSGVNETVVAAPSYFTFNSSDPSVIQVSELGVLTPVGIGTTTISATLGGVRAKGSARLTVQGGFEFAPVPTRDPANVISVFSDTYTNVPGVNTNPNFGGQTTTGGTVQINADNQIIIYENLNFVATVVDPTIDVSGMTHLHVDIRIDETIDASDSFRFELFDFGADGAFGGGNDTGGAITYTSGQLQSGTWLSFDIPFSSFTAATGGGATGFVGSAKTNLAQIVFASGGISAVFVDNIYFYTE